MIAFPANDRPRRRGAVLRSTLVAARALVAAVGTSSCGDGASEPDAAPTTTAPATTDTGEATTTTGPEPITAAEERWLRLLTRYNERFEREYFRGGAVTHGSMRRDARLFRDCRATLRRAGDPGRMAPAAKRVQGACARLGKAARLLEQAIAVSDPGGSVVAGSDAERTFDRAHGQAAEAAERAHYALQRADEIGRDIESRLPS